MSCSIYRTVNEVGIPDVLIRRTVTTVLKAVRERESIVAVHVVGEDRMRTLNRKYRRKDKPTDVLSFPLTTTDGFVPEQELGDIFLCPSYLRRQARRFHVTATEECVRMLVHGTLHLLGYDHMKPRDARIMMPLQESLVRTII